MQILPKEFLLWIAIDGLNYNTDGFSFLPNDHYWWWRATRVINTFDIVSNSSLDYTITEFPFFTFALADLHPHLIAIPFYLMFITLLFNFMLIKDFTSITSGSKTFSNNIFILFISLTFGSLMAINTWNTPSILFLLFGVSIVPIRNYFEQKIIHRFKISTIISLFGAILFIPFFVNYRAPVSEIGIVGTISSRFIHIFTVWGLFITIILFFATCLYLNKDRYFSNRLQNLSLSILPIISIIIIWAIGIFAKDLSKGNLVFMLINKNLSLLLISYSFILLLYFLISKNEISITLSAKYLTTESINTVYFIITIVAIGILFIIIPEYFFIKDQFGNRMNTVFKFGFQSWILLSIFSPVLIYSALTYIKRFRVPIYISFIFITILYLYYSIGFINLQIANWDNSFNLNTHKKYSIDNKFTYDSIEWVRNHLPEGSILLEAPGDSYSNGSKISSFSGYPTVLGWIGHERQWRPFQLEEIANREKDIENIYISNNIDRVQELINDYKIQYIYVGIQEYLKYGESNIAKNTFRSFGKRIYQSEEMINGSYIYIYDVDLVNE